MSQLIPAICTQCGATLSINKEKDAMICPYCGAAFIVKAAIDQFNSTYNITVRDGGTVVINQNKHSSDFEIIGGVLNKYLGNDEKVTIPNSVISIGDSAFKGTKIKEVILPNSVKHIGKYAFSETEIESLDIPDSIEEIEEYAFYGLKRVTNIRLPQSPVKISRVLTFAECPNLKSIKNLTKKLIIENEGNKTKLEKFEYVLKTQVSKFRNCPIENIEIDGNLITTNGLNSFLNRIKDDESYLRAIARFFEFTSMGTQALKYLIRKREVNKMCLLCGAPMSGLLIKSCTNCHTGSSYQEEIISLINEKFFK